MVLGISMDRQKVLKIVQVHTLLFLFVLTPDLKASLIIIVSISLENDNNQLTGNGHSVYKLGK